MCLPNMVDIPIQAGSNLQQDIRMKPVLVRCFPKDTGILDHTKYKLLHHQYYIHHCCKVSSQRQLIQKHTDQAVPRSKQPVHQYCMFLVHNQSARKIAMDSIFQKDKENKLMSQEESNNQQHKDSCHQNQLKYTNSQQDTRCMMFVFLH
jgi:hypothetical protein